MFPNEKLTRRIAKRIGFRLAPNPPKPSVNHHQPSHRVGGTVEFANENAHHATP
jgi:hypothetical protein